jgi:GNAT superfamily N-acetyltransferase
LTRAEAAVTLQPPSLPGTSFRIATLADADCISALAMQVYLNTYATEGIRPLLVREIHTQLSIAAISALLADPAKSFILVERAEHLIAFAQITQGATNELVATDNAVKLNRLYVQERFAGQGLGKALLHHVEALAAASGASKMWLTAWAKNLRALAFYAAQGYVDVGTTMYRFEHEAHENRLFVKEIGEQ